MPNKTANPERVRPPQISAAASVDTTPSASNDEPPPVASAPPVLPPSVPLVAHAADEASSDKEAKDAESIADADADADADFYDQDEYFEQQNFEYVAQYSTPLYVSPEITEQKVKEQM